MSIEVRNVSKFFGEFQALKEVSLHVPVGELVALLGPSGCGKTTLLRIIAGLETADHGSILFHGEDTTSQKVRERKVGFVFQHYALFRHMTVFDNVAFGLKVRPRKERPARAEIRKRVMDLLTLVQLHTLADRYPSELSGGQRQRVALARALAVEPRVLLLDEPFGALDAKVRKELRRWLRRLHDEIHITSVFVTHDQEEALEVADRVAVMNEGRIEQEGTPEEVYHSPKTPFILNFLGNVNLFHGRMENGRAYIANTGVEVPSIAFQDKQTATIFIRPHLLDIHHHPTPDNGCFPARIAHINAAGPLVRIELTSDWGDPVEVEMTHARYRELELHENDPVFITPKELRVAVEDYSI